MITLWGVAEKYPGPANPSWMSVWDTADGLVATREEAEARLKRMKDCDSGWQQAICKVEIEVPDAQL